MDGSSDPERSKALEDYKNTLLQSREVEAKLKTIRLDIKGLQKDFDTTEDNIKALQSVGQIIGEVLKQLDEERCKFCHGNAAVEEITADQCTHIFQSSSKLHRVLDMSSAVGQRSTRQSSSKALV